MAAATRFGGHGNWGAATSTSAAFEADTSWGTPLLSADGTALELSIGSAPEGDGPCEQRFRHQVIETLVQWTEGGLDITVRAELMSANTGDPNSFANPDLAFIGDTLVQVADGIVVP